MSEISEIKIIMTIAMIFYSIALFLGINQKKYNHSKWIHPSLATVGFVLDMWATYMMETLNSNSFYFSTNLLWTHTIISTLAILFFFVMLFLGLTKRIKTHKKVIWYAFTPSWLLAYISGIYLIS